jgi:hypothetical protein
MKIWFKSTLLILSVFVLILIPSETIEVAHCSDCPQARLSEDNYVQCLDGQTAMCKSGPECTCRGAVSKTNECRGACGVRTNWGKCTIQCQKGQLATCVPGKSEWVGFRQVITEEHCYCGGPGGVTRVGMLFSPNDDLDEVLTHFKYERVGE